MLQVLSNTIKQKRKEKAGKWEVPLPKVRPIAEDEMFKVLKSGKRRRELERPSFLTSCSCEITPNFLSSIGDFCQLATCCLTLLQRFLLLGKALRMGLVTLCKRRLL